MFLDVPLWLDSERCPWACVRDPTPRVLATTESCATCQNWEPRPEVALAQELPKRASPTCLESTVVRPTRQNIGQVLLIEFKTCPILDSRRIGKSADRLHVGALLQLLNPPPGVGDREPGNRARQGGRPASRADDRPRGRSGPAGICSRHRRAARRGVGEARVAVDVRGGGRSGPECVRAAGGRWLREGCNDRPPAWKGPTILTADMRRSRAAETSGF